MPSHTTLCLHCGFNRATGKRAHGARRYSSRRWGKAFLGVIGVALVVGLAAAVPFGWRWYKETWKEFQRERIQQAVAALNEHYPSCAIGEVVTLRRVTGTAAKGILVGVGPEGVILQSSKGKVATFPYYLFDGATLLRFDEVLRREAVRRQAALPESWWERARMLWARPAFVLDAEEAERYAGGRHCAFCRDTRVAACAQCGGRGTLPEEARKACAQCGGTGMYTPRGGAGKARCPFCRGAGYLADTVQKACPACGGTGKVRCPHCSP